MLDSLLDLFDRNGRRGAKTGWRERLAGAFGDRDDDRDDRYRSPRHRHFERDDDDYSSRSRRDHRRDRFDDDFE